MPSNISFTCARCPLTSHDTLLSDHTLQAFNISIKISIKAHFILLPMHNLTYIYPFHLSDLILGKNIK